MSCRNNFLILGGKHMVYCSLCKNSTGKPYKAVGPPKRRRASVAQWRREPHHISKKSIENAKKGERARVRSMP